MLERLTPEEARRRIEKLEDDIDHNDRRIEILRDENNETREVIYHLDKQLRDGRDVIIVGNLCEICETNEKIEYQDVCRDCLDKAARMIGMGFTLAQISQGKKDTAISLDNALRSQKRHQEAEKSG